MSATVRAVLAGLVALVLWAAMAGPATAKILVAMDESQTDHLKAYGLAFWALERGARIDWMLTVSYTHLTLPTN